MCFTFTTSPAPKLNLTKPIVTIELGKLTSASHVLSYLTTKCKAPIKWLPPRASKSPVPTAHSPSMSKATAPSAKAPVVRSPTALSSMTKASPPVVEAPVGRHPTKRNQTTVVPALVSTAPSSLARKPIVLTLINLNPDAPRFQPQPQSQPPDAWGQAWGVRWGKKKRGIPLASTPLASNDVGRFDETKHLNPKTPQPQKVLWTGLTTRVLRG